MATTERLVKTTLELKDVIMIVTVAISIASAFFLYDKRLAVVELQASQTTKILEQMQQDDKRREEDVINRREAVDKSNAEVKTEIEILKLNQEVQLGIKKGGHKEQHKEEIK